jgi:hypothetical protein
MIKNNVEFRRGSKEKEYFDKIKSAIMKAPTFLILDFGREFFLYTLAFDIGFATILL